MSRDPIWCARWLTLPNVASALPRVLSASDLPKLNCTVEVSRNMSEHERELTGANKHEGEAEWERQKHKRKRIPA